VPTIKYKKSNENSRNKETTEKSFLSILKTNSINGAQSSRIGKEITQNSLHKNVNFKDE
jgi:hypothetical protein